MDGDFLGSFCFLVVKWVYRRESKTGQSYNGPKARKPHDSYGFLHYSK
jgi:hypothetical protein